MEGLSPLGSLDSNADLFSNTAVNSTATPAVTNYEFNSVDPRGSKGQGIISKIPTWFQKWENSDFEKKSTNLSGKTHKFRFWLNKKDQLFPPIQDIMFNAQASICNGKIPLDLFSDNGYEGDDNETVKMFSSQASIYAFDSKESEFSNTCSTASTFISQASIYRQHASAADIESSNSKLDVVKAPISHTPIYDFDEPDLTVVTPRENDGLLRGYRHIISSDVALDTHAAIYESNDDKHYLESLQDVLILGKGMCDVVSIPVDRQSPIRDMRIGHSAETTLEVLSQTWLDTDSSWEACAARCNKTGDKNSDLSFAKKRSRLRTLLNYLRNKLSGKRFVSEMQLLKTLWHSVLIDHKNASRYYHYC
ncbi:hypothetical protein ZYGR_0AS01850 [Zygosaccharomyces rouxii]|uniref:Uncharacterized protein n=1 Tax=Zygosaccharomyces rouxii TaxID=4956 RepID=A0A1Q3AGT4_ZYGRO|nr:hypothetical protein ZYGR_0AS01850 [Zygosaccharomyces rouxii]